MGSPHEFKRRSWPCSRGQQALKPLTPMLIDTLLAVLGIRLAIVDDPEAIASMEGRWEQRNESNVRRNQRVSQRILNRARPVILQEVVDALAGARDRAFCCNKKVSVAEAVPQIDSPPTPKSRLPSLAAPPSRARICM